MSKYVVTLRKTIERTVIIDANNDVEADEKLNKGIIEKEWQRVINQNGSYGDWNYESDGHYVIESEDELITCADDLARLYGEDDASRLERALYKYTDCGMCAKWTDEYISLVGYVEGCDGEHPSETLYFPFTVQKFRQVRDKLEALADEMWHEWNDDEDEESDGE